MKAANELRISLEDALGVVDRVERRKSRLYTGPITGTLDRRDLDRKL